MVKRVNCKVALLTKLFFKKPSSFIQKKSKIILLMQYHSNVISILIFKHFTK